MSVIREKRSHNESLSRIKTLMSQNNTHSKTNRLIARNQVRSSSPEAWRRTIYASPKHMRRRNVYDKGSVNFN